MYMYNVCVIVHVRDAGFRDSEQITILEMDVCTLYMYIVRTCIYMYIYMYMYVYTCI